jgi:hypothetical protein
MVSVCAFVSAVFVVNTELPPLFPSKDEFGLSLGFDSFAGDNRAWYTPMGPTYEDKAQSDGQFGKDYGSELNRRVLEKIQRPLICRFARLDFPG